MNVGSKSDTNWEDEKGMENQEQYCIEMLQKASNQELRVTSIEKDKFVDSLNYCLDVLNMYPAYSYKNDTWRLSNKDGLRLDYIKVNRQVIIDNLFN